VELLEAFTVTNGTKQGCILATMQFNIFVIMLLVAFKDCDLGDPIQFNTEGNVFNERWLQAKSKVALEVIRALFADDCAH